MGRHTPLLEGEVWIPALLSDWEKAEPGREDDG